MKLKVSAYIPGTSLIHACDARVKLVLLTAYSITLFFVQTWVGLGVCMLFLGATLALSGIRPKAVFGLLVPIYVIVAFTIIFNGFAFDVSSVTAVSGGLGGVSAGVFGSMEPVALIGSFGFVPAGFGRGCFYALRIILLVAGSLLVSFSTTSTDLTAALNDFLKPLRAFRVPTDDVAMVFSLALRFIPVTAEELGRVRDAQWARGAAFSEGTLWQRLSAWQTVLIPLFVGLFRRAESLAIAMDSRCYGTPDVTRTSIVERRFTVQSAGILLVGLAVCSALAVWL